MKKGYYGEYTGNARHSRKQEMIHDRELIYDAKSDIHSEDKKYRDSGSDSDKRDMIHERELIHDTKTQLHHADQDYKSDGPHYQPGEIYVKDEGTEKMDAEMKHLDGMVGAGLSIINALDEEKEEEEESEPDGTRSAGNKLRNKANNAKSVAEKNRLQNRADRKDGRAERREARVARRSGDMTKAEAKAKIKESRSKQKSTANRSTAPQSGQINNVMDKFKAELEKVNGQHLGRSPLIAKRKYAPNTGQGMLESWGYEASATNIDARKSKAN